MAMHQEIYLPLIAPVTFCFMPSLHIHVNGLTHITCMTTHWGACCLWAPTMWGKVPSIPEDCYPSYRKYQLHFMHAL